MPTPSKQYSDQILDSKVYRIIDANRLYAERLGIECLFKSIKTCARVIID